MPHVPLVHIFRRCNSASRLGNRWGGEPTGQVNRHAVWRGPWRGGLRRPLGRGFRMMGDMLCDVGLWWRCLQDLDDLVEAALEFYGEKKLLDSRPLTPLVASPLKFPRKLATDLVTSHLFISDSNHHRIVCAKVIWCFIWFMQLSCRWLVGVDKGEWIWNHCRENQL